MFNLRTRSPSPNHSLRDARSPSPRATRSPSPNPGRPYLAPPSPRRPSPSTDTSPQPSPTSNRFHKTSSAGSAVSAAASATSASGTSGVSVASAASGVSTSTPSQAPPHSALRAPSPSLSRIDPLGRVFPLPPHDSGASRPTINPGSVRSVTVQRQNDIVDDDRLSSRPSTRSQIKTPTSSSRPPLSASSVFPSSSPTETESFHPMINGGESSNGHEGVPPVPPLPAGITPGSKNADMHLEHAEAADRVGALSAPSDNLGVIGSFDRRLNRSVMSLGTKAKAEKILSADPQPRLASLYLVSGLGKDPAQWALSDKDATIGVQPLEDSLGAFWRPDMLGNTFSGEKNEDWNSRQTKHSGRSIGSVLRRDLNTKTLPGAGPEGASRLVARTMKYAHPKDIEVVNSTLAPPTTCHTFTFSVSRHSTLQAIAQANRSKGGPYDAMYNYSVSTEQPSAVPPAGQEHLRGTTSSSDLVFYGVTLTVWSHADKDRAGKLKDFKARNAIRTRADSLLSDANTAPKDRGSRRRKTNWGPGVKRGGALSDYTASETGMSDSDLDTTFTATDADYSLADVAPAYGGEATDVFWLPYALTLVSRYPIYDLMQDYLRLSWARYSKDARAHMRQIFSLLNSEAPRPGDIFKLSIGTSSEDEVAIEAVMPGALDFEKGTIKVDFQLWPIFHALDIDHIITCVEVALSNSGRVIFCSRHPAMLGSAVETLRYIVELRGWNGIALPNIHIRDVTFVIEDPGPYIIGLPSECRYIITPPSEVVVVDLDNNTLTCKSYPPGVVTPRHKREKARHKLLTAFGHAYPNEKSVPTEYRVSFPKGAFRNINRVHHGPTRPRYLAERLMPPEWWNQGATIAVFDKIMADKHKKPSLFQRLTKSGFARQQEQLTANEKLAKAMMRKRALHYVEKRDDFELKVSRITRRLQKLIQEGEHWKQRFEMFEKYAERLSAEANDLKGKIDREQREARRLSTLNSEQSKQNVELQQKLSQTENARAEAMRQLSDMHQSIQELERERNEIMDAIEMQITSAILVPHEEATSPSQASHGSPPGSPTTTLGSNAGTLRKSNRPGTRESTQSAFSFDSKPVSVLGALHDSPKRRGLGSIADTDQISTADRVLSMSNGNSAIAQRVALIQAKLELALAPVRELAADEGSQTTETPEINAIPPSRVGSPDSGETEKLGRKVPGPSSVQVSPPSDDGSTDSTSDFTPVGDGEQTVTSRSRLRSLVLRPPPRRIPQKKSYESIRSASSATSASDKTARNGRNDREGDALRHGVVVDDEVPEVPAVPERHRKDSHISINSSNGAIGVNGSGPAGALSTKTTMTVMFGG